MSVCLHLSLGGSLQRHVPSLSRLGFLQFGPTSHKILHLRQFHKTRLTNAFSKKAVSHAHAVALYFMYYNFCRVHTTLTKEHPMRYPTTPAMAAGVTDHVWKVEEILALMDPATMLQSN